ncbi:MAG: two pore domain potassium channel family protein [Clostridia bacterium]|nr:two pore domain potassium channel family protein [Clostridia bacterium]
MKQIWIILKKTGAYKIISGFFSFLLLCALVIWRIEAEVKTFGEALWYCFATVSTIGFGDITVDTTVSRILTVLLSVYAVATLAIFTAVIVNYFQQVISRGQKEKIHQFMKKLERLPKLSPDELEQLSLQAREWNKG